MKKFFLIFSGIIIVFFIMVISYYVIMASNSVRVVDNYLEFQKVVDSQIDSYGYSLDDPLVIIDPYDMNLLSAMIVFQTDDYVSPSVIVKGQNNDDIVYTYPKSRIHHLPVYCLYADYDNKVIIKVNNVVKEINIKTDSIDFDNSILDSFSDDNLRIITSIDNHLVIYDRFKNIRGYFKEKFSGNPVYLDNGHYIVSSYQLNNNGSYMGIVEVDLLGKVYNQLIVPGGYYGLSFYDENTNYLYALSDKLLVIDMQTWEIIKDYNIDKLDYQYIKYDYSLNKIYLGTDEKTVVIDFDGTSEVTNDINYLKNINYLVLDRNITLDEYRLLNYKVYGTLDQTASSKNIALLSYKKMDSYYDKFGIDLYKESDRLVISSKESIGNGYIILDKFLDKHTYSLNEYQTVINSTSLSGKYSIYIKIDNEIYKTDYYVVF